MDDHSTSDLRGAAVAANLRRAFAAPVGGEMPSAMAGLMRRIRDASTVSEPRWPETGRVASSGLRSAVP